MFEGLKALFTKGDSLVINIPSRVDVNIKVDVSITLRVKPIGPRKPGPISVTFIGELMADVLKGVINLPAVVDTDVKSRELTVTVGTTETVVSITDLSVLESPIEVVQDGHFKVSLVDIDDAGNRSPESVFGGDATDTFAPAQPGQLGVTFTSEDVTP